MIKFKYMKLHKSILTLCVVICLHFLSISQVPSIYNTNDYVPSLKNHNIAVVVNHS